jgi:hypothetical protein
LIPGRRAWLWAAAAWGVLFLISRAAGRVSAAVLDPETIVLPGDYVPPDTSGMGEVLVGNWLRADALWYLKIADQGYGDFGTYAFFPLLPVAARVLAPLVGGSHIAALILANVACLAGLALLYSFFERLFNADAARAGIIGLGLFPTAFFLTAPYGEAQLLLFGAGALFAGANRRWLPSSIFGALSALTRPFGFLIFIPLAALGWRDPRKAWPAVAAPIVAFAGWAVWVGIDSGDLLHIFRVQSIWQRQLEWPPLTVLSAIQNLVTVWGSSLGPYYLMDVVALLAAVGLILGIFIISRSDKLPPTANSLAIYGSTLLVIPLSVPFPPRPLLSIPRFALALFPLFASYRLLRRVPLVVALVISASGLAWAAAAFVAARPIF